MALNKTALKSSLKAALLEQRNLKEDPTAAADSLAAALSDAIDAFVKSGQVNPGIPVSTTGTAAAQTGATTGPGMIS